MLIVKVVRGLIVRDTPRPESEGGRPMRSIPVGAQVYAWDIHNIGGVNYARLVSQNPQRPEWVRVSEADNSIVYVDVIPLESSEDASLVHALHELTVAVKEVAKR